jgi:hypothetical protein
MKETRERTTVGDKFWWRVQVRRLKPDGRGEEIITKVYRAAKSSDARTWP